MPLNNSTVYCLSLHCTKKLPDNNTVHHYSCTVIRSQRRTYNALLCMHCNKKPLDNNTVHHCACSVIIKSQLITIIVICNYYDAQSNPWTNCSLSLLVNTDCTFPAWPQVQESFIDMTKNVNIANWGKYLTKNFWPCLIFFVSFFPSVCSKLRWWHWLQPAEEGEHWRSDPGDSGGVWALWWWRRLH